MLSRTADHLFWMARTIERADHGAAGALAAQAHARAAGVKARSAGRSQNTARRCSRPGAKHA
jgi:uncharacterized alpha-E superfamily protein